MFFKKHKIYFMVITGHAGLTFDSASSGNDFLIFKKLVYNIPQGESNHSWEKKLQYSTAVWFDKSNNI